MSNEKDSIKRAADSVAQMVAEWFHKKLDAEGLASLSYIIDKRLRRFAVLAQAAPNHEQSPQESPKPAGKF